MSEQLFSSFSYEQLKTGLSEDVFRRLAPLIQSVQQTPQITEFISRKEVARLLRVSLPTISCWTREGRIIGYRIGSRIRFKRNEIENAVSKIKTR